MKEVYQIPRHALAWILASLMAVILPHISRMPPWLTGLCVLCIGGRILIHQGRMSYPGNLIKIALVVATVAAVTFQFGRNVFSTEATVGVLVVGIALKLLEMRQKRDVLLVIYLCYFTVVAEFIYSQSIPIAVYMVFCIVLITCGLMSLTQIRGASRPWRTFRQAGVIMVQSVPVMLVLFLLFPRVSPLWSVPLQTGGGVTGLSETMSPGDIGDLTRSGEVAFRVQFEGAPPAYSQLYWRGLTLDLFDGRQWRRRDRRQAESQYLGNSSREVQPWFSAIEYQGEPVRYSVIMEPSFQNWLFTLKMPRMQEENLRMVPEYQVEHVNNITQRYSYDATSWLEHGTQPQLSGELRDRNLQLPAAGNPRSRDFSRQLQAEAGGERDYIEAVLVHFRQEAFYYTLSPQVLGADSVDDFLFSTREGFCEHFASAFTFLMRAAGIPARVVTGYQGGEFNPYDGTLILRQYDAHAWSEVWLEGEGWVRVDPTAAVAPQRINFGSERAFQADERFLEDAGFSLLRFRGNLFMNDLRLRIESIDYAWNRFVLNYDEELQFRLFERLFDDVTREKILFTLLGLIVAVVAVVVFFIMRKPARRRLDPATELYLRFCRCLEKQGLGRQPGETPWHYCRRVSRQRPAWSGEVSAITDAYVDLAFAGSTQRKDRLRQLKRRIRRFRLVY